MVYDTSFSHTEDLGVANLIDLPTQSLCEPSWHRYICIQKIMLTVDASISLDCVVVVVLLKIYSQDIRYKFDSSSL